MCASVSAVAQMDFIGEDVERERVRQRLCQTVPLSVIYGLYSPDNMVHGLNTLFGECIERQEPLRSIKDVTRPPAPWMNVDQIRELQAERDKLGRDCFALSIRSVTLF